MTDSTLDSYLSALREPLVVVAFGAFLFTTGGRTVADATLLGVLGVPGLSTPVFFVGVAALIAFVLIMAVQGDFSDD